MSDDMFDGMITSNGANTLFAAGDMFGQQQANNQLYGQQVAGLQQDMMQFTLAQNAQAASERQQSRQFQLQSQQEDRKLAALREESAFARLNQSLDRQLKYAELETQERQQAFENTLRAQQVGLQAQMQSMQIQQIETAMNAQKAIGARTLFNTTAIEEGWMTGAGGLQGYAERLKQHKAENRDLYLALGQTPEGQKMMEDDARMVEAIKLYATDTYSIDEDMVGDALTVGKAEELVKSVNLVDRAPTGNERQAFAYFAKRAESEMPDDELEEIFADAKGPDGRPLVDLKNAPPETRAAYRIRALAEKNGGNDYWDSINAQLSNPAGLMRFEELYSRGLLEPVKDKSTLMQLQALDQSKMQTMAQLMSESNGTFLFAPQYEKARQDLKNQMEESRATILSGGDVSGNWALGGAVSFGIVNDNVKKQMDLAHANKRTWSDVAELTGVPGALRAAKSLVLGGQVNSNWDYFDLATLPIMLIPGGGFAVRSVYGAGKWALGAAMKGVGKAAGKGMMAGGAKMMSGELAKLTGKAALQASARASRLAPALTARAKSYTAFAAQAAAWPAGAARGAERAAAYTAKAARTSANAARLTEDAAKASSLLYGKLGARIAAPAMAARAATLAPGIGPNINYGDLDVAADKVSTLVDQLKLKSYPPAMRAQITQEIGNAMQEYKRTAERYFPDGQVPASVMRNMLSMGNLVPRRILEQLQGDLLGGAANMYNGVPQVSLESMLGGQSAKVGIGGLTMVSAPAATSGTGMDDLFNRPQQ